ncbi:serine protease [Haliscomenobacter sp.]|uniref:serine protease n=1 Tax=Haliscomenobacter sp. TaxID=2717303 RepID=UPI003364C477
MDKLSFDVYLQDPFVAENNLCFGFHTIEIEPDVTLSNGPTSTRFVVVDFNGHTGEIAKPAIWDAKKRQFTSRKKVLDKKHPASERYQYNQVHVWALAEYALAFFEAPQAMGRQLSWGFNGNRLILVPHAGMGKNAYYDRDSKSLQFYYFPHPDQPDKLVYTCLSADIVNHEFGHAVLDGIRPGFIEGFHEETGAFHEFLGDFSAILLLLNHTKFRESLSESYEGSSGSPLEILGNIAEEFGETVKGQAFLRSAFNKLTLKEVEGQGVHAVSTVLTGACYDILLKLAAIYIERIIDRTGKTSIQVAREAYTYAIQRARRTFLQALDFLPPTDARFRDYAIAVLRNQELADPLDPHQYRKMMADVFLKRGILYKDDMAELFNKERYLFDINNPGIKRFKRVYEWSRSKRTAYDFIHENRETFCIPPFAEIEITDVYQSEKMGRQNLLRPRQFVLEFIWKEEITLEGDDFPTLDGKKAALICGGTLVFDENNSLLHYVLKPGTQFSYKPAQAAVLAEGETRKAALLKALGLTDKTGLAAATLAHPEGFMKFTEAPHRVVEKNGLIHLQFSPHLDLSNHPSTLQPSWQISF